MWFHRPFRADDWLLFVVSLTKCLGTLLCSLEFCPHANISSVFQIASPAAYNARGFCAGQMFNRKGEVNNSYPYVWFFKILREKIERENKRKN